MKQDQSCFVFHSNNQLTKDQAQECAEVIARKKSKRNQRTASGVFVDFFF